MKKCFKCGQEKELSEFYKHPQMLDGHLNKCKECTKNDVHKDYAKNVINPEWKDKEKQRSKDKYYRLNYRSRSFELKKNIPYIDSSYKGLNKWMTKRVFIKKDEQIHHWNYNKIKDVIVVNKDIHRKIHTYIKPIKSGQYYGLFTDLDGFVLTTKEDHISYIIKKLKENGISDISIHCHDFTYEKIPA